MPADPAVLPIAPGERAHSVDALRGFALLGIFLVNLIAFSGFEMLGMEGWHALPTMQVDFALGGVTVVLLLGKFYSLFSLLFGLGFAMYLSRGAEALPRFRRRLAVLLAIGLAHALLIWDGDILVLYALLGFLLIPFRHLSDRALLRWVVVLVLAPVLVDLIRVLTEGRFAPAAPFEQWGTRADAWAGYKGEPGLTEYLAPGLQSHLRWTVAGFPWRYHFLIEEGRPFKVLAMFVLGLWAGRHGLIFRPEQHMLLLRRILRYGLLVGLPVNVGMLATFALELTPPAPAGLLRTIAYAVGVVPLALAIGAGFLLWWTRPDRRPWLERLVPAGRMALTNYLLQSVVAILVFRGIGLGLGGRVGPTVYLPAALVFFAGQVWLSRWWLERWRYGPVEWIWRQLTYGTRLPLRRAQ